MSIKDDNACSFTGWVVSSQEFEMQSLDIPYSDSKWGYSDGLNTLQ